MLNEEDKEKVRLEELYRIEVRKQLTDKPETSRLWLFLNSTFVLWFLSAFLVTWGTVLYDHQQSKKAEEQKKSSVARNDALKNDELIERLDLEIGYRLSQFQIRLASLVDWESGNPSYKLHPGNTQKDVAAAIDSLSRPPTAAAPPLYEEFSRLSTLALVAELRRHVPLAQKAELDHVIADLSGIHILLDVKKVQLADVHSLAEVVFSDLTLPRWKIANFYFSDCPFC